MKRILALLSHLYYWPKMGDDIEMYVQICLIYQLDKTESKKEAGLLHLLPISTRPWVSVFMDFISKLPRVDAMRSIFVVIHRFSKYIVFITTPHVCQANRAAELFFKHLVKHYALPEDIESDRGTRFTGRFRIVLFGLMGSELKFSITNHPQTNGQTKRMMNALLKEYLRHYVSTLR